MPKSPPGGGISTPIRSSYTTCTARRRLLPTNSRVSAATKWRPALAGQASSASSADASRARKWWACAPIWMPCRSKRRPICPTDRPCRARCTPAVTTATPRCCPALPNILPTHGNFAGTAVVIFQPAEEGGAGARAMLRDGLLDRFGIQEVYGMHNFPGMPVGEFAIRPGPAMASTDTIAINLEGKGGHAAWPHLGIDPVLVGAQIVNQLQSIVSRNVDPVEAAVISICVFQAGEAVNVIPQRARLGGTVRCLSPRSASYSSSGCAKSWRGRRNSTAPRRTLPTRLVIRSW